MYEKLDSAVSLINQWNVLNAEVQQMKEYKDYLEKPIMNKREFIAAYPDKEPVLLSRLSKILVFVSVISFLLMLLSIFVCDFLVGPLLFLAVIALPVGALMGSSAKVKMGSGYAKYYNHEVQHREKCSVGCRNYEEKQAKLQQLENLLSNPQVCEIPRQYWNQADMIVTLVKSGAAKNVPDAVVKLGGIRY